jgi:hypothetical protein
MQGEEEVAAKLSAQLVAGERLWRGVITHMANCSLKDTGGEEMPKLALC